MIHVDKPFSKPMNTVTKHTNISFQTIYLLSSFRPRTPTILIFGSPIDIFELTMSKNSRSSSSSSSSSLSSSSGNVKLSKVVAAIPRAFVSLANPAANSASFQTSSANVSMVRPAPNVTSVKPSSSNVSMVRPAQSSLASSPAVNVGQRSKSAKARTNKDCVDKPVAIAIPSDSPSPILSLTSEALSKSHSHPNDGESFSGLSYIDSTPYLTDVSPRTEGPDSNTSAPNSGGEEEPPRNNWGTKSDDGQPDLENETEAEMDVSLEKYTRQGRANTRIPK